MVCVIRVYYSFLLIWLLLIFIPEGLKSTQIIRWLLSRLVEEAFEINFSCILLPWMRTIWLWLKSWFAIGWGLQGFANYFIKLLLGWFFLWISLKRDMSEDCSENTDQIHFQKLNRFSTRLLLWQKPWIRIFIWMS